LIGEFLDFLDMSCDYDVLPAYRVESIKTWLVGTLQKYESPWVNHKLLYAESMNMCTNSIAKSLHEVRIQWSLVFQQD
jgi:hypothetical protein